MGHRHYIPVILAMSLLCGPVAGEGEGLGFITTETPYGLQFIPELPNGTVAASYYWEFGDGSISTEESPTHYYRDPGEYLVTLTVEKDPVGIITISETVKIGERGTLLTVLNSVQATEDGLIIWLNGERMVYPEAALMVGGVLLTMNAYMSEQEARKYRKRGQRDTYKNWRQFEMFVGCLMLFAVIYIEVIVKGGLVY